MMRWLIIVVAVALALGGCGEGRGAAAVAAAGCPPAQIGSDAPLSGCPQPWLDTAAITVGVACRAPNSIACERIGVGVWIWHRATRVLAELGGRMISLSGSGPGLWQGYLYGAGQRRGPLAPRVPAGRTHWIGDPPLCVALKLFVFLRGGAERTVSTSVLLHPGFG
jgi:hypothetical protein